MNAPAKGIPAAAVGGRGSTRGWSEKKRLEAFTQVVELVEQRAGLARGPAVTLIANRLGLDEGTLYGWLSKGESRKKAPWYFLDLLRYELLLADIKPLC